MPTTLDRLRRLHNLREQRSHSEPQPAPRSPSSGATGARLPLDQAEPGYVYTNAGGEYYVVTRTYPVNSTRGVHTLDRIFAQRPAIFAPSFPKYALQPHHQFQRAAFIDTETTGLGTGAGVYCFIIGVGTFENLATETKPGRPSATPSREPSHFVVRQFFMRNPAEEAAVLMAVADLLADRELSVTFNGRSFDLPLLRTRYRQNRKWLPIDTDDIPMLNEFAPHLDLLHPSRRIWKRRLGSCRLLNLEQHILQIERSEQDVPGHLIPLLYADYLRTGNASPMSRVFYHNREDIISMVGLTAHLVQAFDTDTVPDGINQLHPLDCISVAESLENADAADEAEKVYRHALDAGLPPAQRVDIFSRLSRLLKRQERWPEAVELWQLWLTTIPGSNPEPFIELAKYCEWRTNDLEQAEMWTSWAIHNIEADKSAQYRQWLSDLRHRLSRIQRKRLNGTSGPAG